MSASTLPTHLPTERDARMVQTLLNSCDPCDRLRNGQSVDAYRDTARDVVDRLARGGGEVEVLLLLGEAEVEAAHMFAMAAVHWWNNRLSLFDDAPGV